MQEGKAGIALQWKLWKLWKGWKTIAEYVENAEGKGWNRERNGRKAFLSIPPYIPSTVMLHYFLFLP